MSGTRNDDARRDIDTYAASDQQTSSAGASRLSRDRKHLPVASAPQAPEAEPEALAGRHQDAAALADLEDPGCRQPQQDWWAGSAPGPALSEKDDDGGAGQVWLDASYSSEMWKRNDAHELPSLERRRKVGWGPER
jgi:hypothetical protein